LQGIARSGYALPEISIVKVTILCLKGDLQGQSLPTLYQAKKSFVKITLQSYQHQFCKGSNFFCKLGTKKSTNNLANYAQETKIKTLHPLFFPLTTSQKLFTRKKTPTIIASHTLFLSLQTPSRSWGR
jgi:hypothetical protein